MGICFVGIDPGVGGGVAVIFPDGTMNAWACPSTVRDMSDSIKIYRSSILFPIVAILESVHSFPGQGISSTFKFGRNYGEWRGILASSSQRWGEVSPPKMDEIFRDHA